MSRADRGEVRVIGLTGGVASGKSTVSGMLRELGAAVIDADQLARRVTEPGEPALAEIAAAFGPDVLSPDGRLDRPRLAQLVFRDRGARERLEAITHPRIRALGSGAVAAARATRPPLIVYDIPLLFEAHREADVDGVLLVYAPAALQRARLRARDHLDDLAAGLRLAAQWPIDEKRAGATWIIENTGDVADTRRQVSGWWRRVLTEPRPPGPGGASVDGSGDA